VEGGLTYGIVATARQCVSVFGYACAFCGLRHERTFEPTAAAPVYHVRVDAYGGLA
jgi:hypothetical protein